VCKENRDTRGWVETSCECEVSLSKSALIYALLLGWRGLVLRLWLEVRDDRLELSVIVVASGTKDGGRVLDIVVLVCTLVGVAGLFPPYILPVAPLP
jgi:hypothetical protein